MANEVEARSLTVNERDLLRKIVRALREPDAAALDSQVDAVTVTGGLPTLLDLSVDRAVEAAPIEDGPLPVRAIVSDAHGEILVWVKSGYLDGLEFAWTTEHAPIEMPESDRITLAP